MSAQKVLIYHPSGLSELGGYALEFFKADQAADEANFTSALQTEEFKVVVFDAIEQETLDLEGCRKLMELDELLNIPLILLTQSVSLQDKLKALEIGCDDFIESTVSGDETCARITKSIFHRIANDQLSKRLDMANDAARTAMVDNSDLGANLQFLLSVHDCDNMDQLGQQFFSTIERYGLKCSLQMRSIMGDKNMEAHGMAKDLEAQLLSQMADSDRFVDFGKRTIVNFDKVSLLVKNMPVEDMEKYGHIKDNTFSLVQGVNARIHALEDQHRIHEEKDSLRKLSQDVNTVMHSLQDSYQDVMRDILTAVEQTAALIQDRVPHLALMESDEEFLEEVTNHCLRETNRIFNEGLVVDEVFQKLEVAVSKTLESVNVPAAHKLPKNNGNDKGGSNTLELF